MKHLKKYQRLIATFVVILLLLQFGIYPCLTMANTFANIVGAIGLLVICVWMVVAFGGDGLIDKDELREAEQFFKEKELGETELDYVPKPKTKATRKPKTPKAK
jgi:nitrate reductase NapE component